MYSSPPPQFPSLRDTGYLEGWLRYLEAVVGAVRSTYAGGLLGWWRQRGAGCRMPSSPLSLQPPPPLPPFWGSLKFCPALPALPVACLLLWQTGVQIWVRSSPNPDAVSLLVSSPWAPFTVSLKALLEMKAMALPLLASHPHFLYCKTSRHNKNSSLYKQILVIGRL